MDLGTILGPSNHSWAAWCPPLTVLEYLPFQKYGTKNGRRENRKEKE